MWKEIREEKDFTFKVLLFVLFKIPPSPPVEGVDLFVVIQFLLSPLSLPLLVKNKNKIKIPQHGWKSKQSDSTMCVHDCVQLPIQHLER